MPEGLNRRSVSVAEVERLAAAYRTWGQWGDEDELGAANRVTGSTVVAATDFVRTGRVFPLSLPLDRDGPQCSGTRSNPQHVMTMLPGEPASHPRLGFADDAVWMPLQAATQWDALAHVFFDGQSYNGASSSSVSARDGAQRNSVTGLIGRSVGRGVLLDLPRFLGRSWLEPGEAIQEEDLEECSRAQGVEIGEGDFVLVRTGQLSQVRDRGSWDDYAGGAAPGLGVSAANFLCGRTVTAVASDTWGLEVKPYEVDGLPAPLHLILLVNAGIYIGEMWDMDALAEDCARDEIYDFLLVAPPLNVTGAVGSPVTPLAIK